MSHLKISYILLLHKFRNFSLFFALYRLVPLLASVLQVVLFSCFGEVLFSFWHVSCCTLWLCCMTSFGQYFFFVNDLVLKFIIPPFLLFAYDRKIWLDVNPPEDCKYLQWHMETVRK